MIYQHPLAYLLGVQGVALLRAFGGAYDREFTEARIAEIRRLLDGIDEFGEGGAAHPVGAVDAYRAWADSYDQPGNQLIDLEGPIVRDILDEIRPGIAVDAACGTGRHTSYLASLGHQVIGVDSSPEMLQHARAAVPGGRFHEADLSRMPVPDECADVVVCALALCHVHDLAPAFAEFLRVLRPGGHLVISDPSGLPGSISLPIVQQDGGGRATYVMNRSRRTSDYLGAALPLGLRLLRCEEPLRPSPLVSQDGAPPDSARPASALDPGNGPPSIWELHRWCVDAVNAAYRDTPAAIVCHFQRSS